MNRFEGEFVRHPNFCTMTIQENAKNSTFLKFSDCGVFLICGDLKNFRLEENKCGLEYLCPGNCYEESVENAVFREIACNLTECE
uniref:Uncharacterized protein n=1 Tax=Caenorhabditis japonica TaxID=281687 RepID=A0A8R1IQJ6_CAEJA